jgi:hypothetical protein
MVLAGTPLFANVTLNVRVVCLRPVVFVENVIPRKKLWICVAVTVPFN